MEQLQNLPIGIQNFEKLRSEGYLYVDKTARMHQMVSTGSYYFLSRPRRFGKSLLVSTLQAYFQGKRELFRGLAIEQLEQEWVARPVLHLDLNTGKYDTPQSVDDVLNEALVQWEALYGKGEGEVTPALRFKGIIRRAYEQSGQRVVILVDEYDKPMLQAIDNEALQTEFREALKVFYSVLKTMDGCIRFAFLTGVTKFGKVSVFSDLNNLMDISMDWRYVDICGISEADMEVNFRPYIQRLADAVRMDYRTTCEQLRRRYDGYHFCEDTLGMYNPFSLLNTFARQRFGNYWFETGTPSYLVYLLKKHHYNLARMASERTTVEALDALDSMSANPIPVIYQSGYLTIKHYDPEFRTYELGFPNEEVEEGFLKYLLPFYTPCDKVEASFQIESFVKEVRSGQTEQFLNRLKAFFADIPYELVKELENHYQNVLFILTKLMGFYVQAEYHTSAGRIDMLLRSADYIYILEFKLDGTAEEALQQIIDRHYAQPFAADHRKVICIGLNFSKQTRNIEKWVVKEEVKLCR